MIFRIQDSVHVDARVKRQVNDEAVSTHPIDAIRDLLHVLGLADDKCRFSPLCSRMWR